MSELPASLVGRAPAGRSHPWLTLRRRLASNAFKALLGTVAGNAVGFLLPFAVTSHYGFGRITDAYFFGLSLAIFGTVLSATVIEANALPLMASVKPHGAHSLQRAARRAIKHSVLGVLAAYIPVAVVGSLVVASRHGWPADLRAAAIWITVILTLLVVIVGATSVLAASSYALGDFLTPTATQSLRSVAPMIGIVFLGRDAGSLTTLAWLMVAGELLRGVILLVKVRAGSRALSATDLPAPQIPSVWRAGAPHAVAMIGVNLLPVVDKIVASRLRASGAVTLLELGEKIFYVPLLGVTYSVILVAGAEWAELNTIDPRRIRADFTRLIRRVLWLSAALALLCCLGAIGLHVIGPDTIAGVPSGKLSLIVVCFMIGLPAGAVVNVGSRLFTATGRTRALPAIAILLLVLDVVFDLIGGQLWGANGIALATTVVRMVSAPIYVFASLAALRSVREAALVT